MQTKNLLTFAVCIAIAALGLLFQKKCGDSQREDSSLTDSMLTPPRTLEVATKDVEYYEPSNEIRSETSIYDDCKVTPPIAGPDYLGLLMQEYSSRDKGEAYVVAVFQFAGEQMDTLGAPSDPASTYYVSPILTYGTFNEDIKFRLYDIMERKLRSRQLGTPIGRCCMAFKNYATASHYVHAFDNRIEVSTY